jgi:hypothetical protein
MHRSLGKTVPPSPPLFPYPAVSLPFIFSPPAASSFSLCYFSSLSLSPPPLAQAATAGGPACRAQARASAGSRGVAHRPRAAARRAAGARRSGPKSGSGPALGSRQAGGPRAAAVGARRARAAAAGRRRADAGPRRGGAAQERRPSWRGVRLAAPGGCGRVWRPARASAGGGAEAGAQVEACGVQVGAGGARSSERAVGEAGSTRR